MAITIQQWPPPSIREFFIFLIYLTLVVVMSRDSHHNMTTTTNDGPQQGLRLWYIFFFFIYWHLFTIMLWVQNGNHDENDEATTTATTNTWNDRWGIEIVLTSNLALDSYLLLFCAYFYDACTTVHWLISYEFYVLCHWCKVRVCIGKQFSCEIHKCQILRSSNKKHDIANAAYFPQHTLYFIMVDITISHLILVLT